MKVQLMYRNEGKRANRYYQRSDGTWWELQYEEDLKVWSIYQVHFNNATKRWDMVFDDPRNGIAESNEGSFACTLSESINRIKSNW